jgi:hypothetical protein
MNLEIPDGANVHIFIGNAPPLALTDQRTALPVRSRGRRILGATIKFGIIGGLLVIGSFWFGEHSGQAANEDAGVGAPPPVTQAFPSAPAAAAGGPTADAAPPSADAGQVPPNFTAQLQQQPTIQPPPGQNSGSANGGQNPFGLGN